MAGRLVVDTQQLETLGVQLSRVREKLADTRAELDSRETSVGLPMSSGHCADSRTTGDAGDATLLNQPTLSLRCSSTPRPATSTSTRISLTASRRKLSPLAPRAPRHSPRPESVPVNRSM